MEKNVGGKWTVFAYGAPDHPSLAGKPITGDAANITANIRIDGGAANAVDDVNPTELEDGYYVFDITAAEANGNLLSLHPESATANVLVIGVPGAVWTRPANFNALGIAADGDLSGNVDGSVASVTGAVGSVTGLVGGITGTIQTLDALDTAQDAQHATTQAALPTVAAIVDGVWLEPIADHSATVGSTAEALNAAGAAGDPWTTALPGAYGAGSAGYLVGTYLDAAVSAAGGLDAAGVRAALGMASANLDAQLDALPTAAEITTSLLTTQMTEAYAADGVAPTMTQALFLIQQVLTDSVIVGTTQTIRKIDGSSTAATLTLNDGSNPTGVTRAT